MESVLVHLSHAASGPSTPSPRTKSTNPGPPRRSGSAAGGEGGEGGEWRVCCQRTLASGDKEQMVFVLGSGVRYEELERKVSAKFGPSVVVTWHDEGSIGV